MGIDSSSPYPKLSKVFAYSFTLEPAINKYQRFSIAIFISRVKICDEHISFIILCHLSDNIFRNITKCSDPFLIFSKIKARCKPCFLLLRERFRQYPLSHQILWSDLVKDTLREQFIQPALKVFIRIDRSGGQTNQMHIFATISETR